MSIIPRSKFGDCSECGTKETNVIKYGKFLYCIDCRNEMKRKQQIERSNQNLQKRSIGNNKESFIDRQSLFNDLDFVFSRYIRIKESNPDGISQCYTCDKKEHWTKLQCGHYIKRGETLLRWDSRNARSQCNECNCIKNGNIEEYTNRLNEEQPGLPDQLKEESREVNKYTRDELKQLLIDLRSKLKMVEKKFTAF